MAKLIICRGLPASGKTTWGKSVVAKESGGGRQHNTIIVCRDDIRGMFGLTKGVWNKNAEKVVRDMRDQLIKSGLSMSKNVISCDTNLDTTTCNHLISIAAETGSEYEIKDFTDVPIAVCIERDKNRLSPVGRKVIRDMHKKYISGNVKSDQKQPSIDPGLRDAIICDLDGTLALLNGRNPYDASTCENDSVSLPVLTVIKAMQRLGKSIIFVSGRSGKYKEQTEQFIFNAIEDSNWCLFMRKEGDARRDSVVKKEIYKEHIEGKCNILFAIDDRAQIVRECWAELGIFTMRVGLIDHDEF